MESIINPVVIGSEYCVEKPVKLIIDMNKGVVHINNELIFQVEKHSFSLHTRRVLRDFSGNPVLTLHKKHMTIHGRWLVFKCDSTDSNDLLFSVKRSSSKTPNKKNIDLEVFLAKNANKESVWDYKVNAGLGTSSCDIYAHGSSTILAKMMTNRSTFEGEVQPNIDYAFIVALIMIVDKINNNSGNSKVGEVFKGTVNTVQGVEKVATGGIVVAGMASVAMAMASGESNGAAEDGGDDGAENGGAADDEDVVEDDDGAAADDEDVVEDDDGAAADDEDVVEDDDEEW